MRYSDERPSLNGHPSWPQLLEVTDRMTDRLERKLESGLIRIHERIDGTQEEVRGEIRGVQDGIQDVRERVIGIETRLEPEPPPRGLLGRLREWAELIAPLRELVVIVAAMAIGLATLLQAPTVRQALLEVMAHIGHRAAE